MASEFDSIRKRRRQRGIEARERVMNRLNNPEPVQSAQNSEYDAIRNRDRNAFEIGAESRKPTYPELQQIGDAAKFVFDAIGGAARKIGGDLIESTKEAGAERRQREAMEPPQAPNKRSGIMGFLGDMAGTKEVFKEGSPEVEAFLAKQDEKRANLPPFVQGLASGFQDQLYKGRLRPLKRFGQGTAKSFGIRPEDIGDIEVSTGSKFADKVLDVTGGIAGYVANPSQLESNLFTGSYNAARGLLNTGIGMRAERGLQNLLSRANNFTGAGLAPKVTDRVAQGILQGVPANALQNAAVGAMAGQTSGEEVAQNALIGGALGGAFDAAAPLLGPVLGRAVMDTKLGQAVKSVLSKYLNRAKNPKLIEDILALPEPKQRGNVNQADSPDVIYDADTRPAGLPEPSPESVNRLRNADEAKIEISSIDDELNALNSRYQQAVNDQYHLLKTSMDSRGGVTQGQLIRDPNGDVTGRIGRQSNNPQWYREFYAENGRAPSNKDLYLLAKKQVDEGYQDDGIDIPSWKAQNDYDEVVTALTQVRQTLSESAAALDGQIAPAADPAVRVGRSPSVSPSVRPPVVQQPQVTAPRVSTTESGVIGPDAKRIGIDYDAEYDRYQGLIDDLETKISGQYGDRSVLYGDGVPPQEWKQLQDLYAARDSIWDEQRAAQISDVLSRIPKNGPASEEYIIKSLKEVQKSFEWNQANKNKIGPSKIKDLVRSIYVKLSHDPSVGLPEDFVGDFEQALSVAKNWENNTYYGLNPAQLLGQVKEIAKSIFGESKVIDDIFSDIKFDYGRKAMGEASRAPVSQYAEERKSLDMPQPVGESIPLLKRDRAPEVVQTPKTTRGPGEYLSEEELDQLMKSKIYDTPPEQPIVDAPTVADAPTVPPPRVPDMEPLGISPMGRGGKYGNPEDTRTYIVTKTDREPFDLETAANKFYSESFDNLQRINQFDKYVESATGRKLSPDERAYYLALNSRGSDMIGKQILTERLVDSKGNAIGQSLKDITKQIPKRSYKQFTDYLIAKHAETRMARGETVYDKKTNMTPEKVAQKIADYEKTYPQFTAIANQLYQFNDAIGKAWLVDTGIIPPQMWERWRAENPFWVPNKRQFTKLEQPKFRGSKRGFANQSNPVRKYSPTGSERPIIDPIESMIEYVDRYVKTAKRNEVMQTIIKILERNPDDLEGFATVLKRENLDPKTVLSEEGPDMLMESMEDEFSRALRKSDLSKGNVISGLVNGKRVYVRINDPAMLDALTNLTPESRSKVIESARKVTNMTKLLTTGINPIFSLTRNIFRDIPASYIFSKTTNNPFRFAWDLLDGVVSSFGNRELYKRYKSVGGGHSSPIASDRNLLAQSKRSILPQQKRGLGLLPKIYNAAENLSNIIEAAPRVAEFKRVTKAGGNDYASRVKGLYEANDITVNFKRHGTAAKEADAFILYLNAALQGLDKTVRAFKDNPIAVVGKSLLAISIPTIGLYALNHRNPKYQELSNYVKDTNFLIPTGDDDVPFVKIPKPRELGVPFGSLIERTMRAWYEKDSDSFKDFADTFATAFAPPGVPLKELQKGDFMDALIAPVRDTILGPIVDVASNENFVGAPVVPGYLEGVSPQLQFDANTSEIGKKIGDILNVSPKQVDHLIRSYTGVVGQVALPATTQGATFRDTLTKQVTADPTFSNDVSRNFYGLKAKYDTMYQDAKATGKVPEGYRDDVRKYLGRIADDLGDISTAIRAVDNMPLTAKEKKDKKSELTEMRNETARTAYEAIRAEVK